METNILEHKVKDEEKIINSINENFSKKRDKISKNPQFEEARLYLKKQNELYHSRIDQFDKKSERLDKIKTALKKEIKRQTLKNFPELKELLKLNSQRNNQLKNALHPGHAPSDFDRGLIVNAELAIYPDSGYVIFEPPYEHLGTNETGDFDDDLSFSWADWGTLAHIVRFSLNDSWTSSWFGAERYATSTVEFGVKYKMPKHGALDITVVLTNTEDYINYSVEDNFGFSETSIDISNMIFISVLSGGRLIYLEAATTVNKNIYSDGDDISGSIHPVTTNNPLIINFSTDHIHEGEDLEIRVASWFRISGSTDNMDTNIFANLLWKVNQIYLKAV